MVLVPDPSYPTKNNFWSILCSKKFENAPLSMLFTSSPVGFPPFDGTGNDKKVHRSFVLACPNK